MKFHALTVLLLPVMATAAPISYAPSSLAAERGIAAPSEQGALVRVATAKPTLRTVRAGAWQVRMTGELLGQPDSRESREYTACLRAPNNVAAALVLGELATHPQCRTGQSIGKDGLPHLVVSCLLGESQIAGTWRYSLVGDVLKGDATLVTEQSGRSTTSVFTVTANYHGYACPAKPRAAS